MKPNNVVEMLSRTVNRYPNKDVYKWKVDGIYQSMTYQQFWDKIYHFASGLAQLGIKANDKVAILSNSNPMWGITDFAVASLGAVSVPIYPTLPSEQVTYALKNAEVCAIVLENEEQMEKVLAGDAKLDMIIVMYPDENVSAVKKTFAFDEVEKKGKNQLIQNWQERWMMIDRDYLLTIIHTSGTTGSPKGAMITHGNILANVEAVQWIVELLPEDISLSYLPISHVFERMAGHYTPLSVGTTIAYAESIDTIRDNLKEIRPTVLTSVPRLFEKVYAGIEEQIKNSSSIKQKIFNWGISIGEQRYEYYLKAGIEDFLSQNYMPKKFYRKWKLANKLVFNKIKGELGGRVRGMISGGGTLNPEVAKFFWAIDLPVMEGYGLTETSPVVSANPMTRAKVGTVGKVLPNLDLKIAKDGEVLVRGPSIMKGYYNNPKATQEAFEGGWFHTGDVGELTEEGYLKIIDRKKRILVLTTGMNVAPQPVESSINESRYIAQSLIIGDNRKYVICLINPDYENLLPWAERNGIPTDSLQTVCRHEKVQQLIESEVARLTKQFARYAQPKRNIIVDEEWTVDGGELTPKLSLRINVIEEKYKDLIEETYKEDVSTEENVAVIS